MDYADQIYGKLNTNQNTGTSYVPRFPTEEFVQEGKRKGVPKWCIRIGWILLAISIMNEFVPFIPMDWKIEGQPLITVLWYASGIFLGIGYLGFIVGTLILFWGIILFSINVAHWSQATTMDIVFPIIFMLFGAFLRWLLGRKENK
jgi:hypothetical protein